MFYIQKSIKDKMHNKLNKKMDIIEKKSLYIDKKHPSCKIKLQVKRK